MRFSRALTWICAALALACGGESGSSDDDGSGAGGTTSGGGTAGSGGAAGASGGTSGGGTSGSGSVYDRWRASLVLVCEQTEACYGTRCEGPAEGGLMVSWGDLASFLDRLGQGFEACFEEVVVEEPGVESWAECIAVAEEQEAECLSSCPATVDACLNAGNAANEACGAQYATERAALEPCLRF